MRQQEFVTLSRKIDMLVYELEAFNDAIGHFETFESWVNSAGRRQIELRNELELVEKSPQASYGLFKTVSKQEKIDEAKAKLSIVGRDVEIGERLYNLISQVMITHEMEIIKKRKKIRYTELIVDFALSRIQVLRDEQRFWETMLGDENLDSDYEVLDQKVLSESRMSLKDL